MVIGDVNNDGVQDVIWASGARCVAINGQTGAYTWQRSGLTGVDSTTQPQMADLDNDGYLEIVVPKIQTGGFYILDGRAGQTETQFSVGGRCDNGPVIANINNSTYPTLFFATMSFVETQDDSTTSNTGFLRSYRYNPGSGSYQQLNSIRIWHPCSGGLTVGDADHDGTFELYMNDRDMTYSDRGYGSGVSSYWAANLSERWRHPDILVSSNKPMLADVNKDGILDVVVNNLRGGLAVLDSITGSAIREESKITTPNGAISGHYQCSVYDIDRDGNLEILLADGEHTITWDMVVFDLVTWTEDARVSGTLLGQCYFGPRICDVTGDGIKDIIISNYTRLFVFDGAHDPSTDGTYPLVWMGGALRSRMMDPVMQDIDNDGKVEIVAASQGGIIYAYDTNAPAPVPRARTELEYASERRNAVYEYVPPPYATPEPIISSEVPIDWKVGVPIGTSQLSFTLKDYQGNHMNYIVTTSPNIGGGSQNDRPDGTYTVTISGLEYNKDYKWFVQVTDGTHWTNRTYSFKTTPATVSNTAPTQNNPSLVSNGGTNRSNESLTCSNQTTYDNESNRVTNVYNWTINNKPLANLIMPFDVASQSTAKDYSGNNNNGVFVGNVTWMNNGIVGGAVNVDKGYVKIPDSNTLDGNNLWNEMSAELWIYLRSNQAGTRVVFKQPCYQIAFRDGATNRLQASVWIPTLDPRTGITTTSMRTASASSSLSLNTWYHVAFTYRSGEGVKLYVNGVQVASATGKGNVQRSKEPLFLGWFDFFNGMLDDVKIYSRCLSPEQVYQNYMQSKDGLSSNSTIVPKETVKGEIWACKVTPIDGLIEGTTKVSNSITELNEPPVASNPRFAMHVRSQYALDNENLIGTYDYFDADKNLDAGTQILWYRNGITVPAYNNLLTVPSSATAVGQVWNFTVRPYDGFEYGIMVASPTVQIISNSAPTSNAPSLSGVRDDDELVARNQTTADVNHDAVTNVYNWLKSGVSLTNLLMPFDLDNTTIAKDYSGYGNNGVLNGSQWVEDGVLGGAMDFDGNDFITVNEIGSTLGGDGSWSKISVELWVRASGATTSTQTVLFKPDAWYSLGSSSYFTGYRLQYRYYADSYRVYWTIGNTTSQVSFNQRVYETPSQWHHVVCTYQSGAGMKIYTDGVLRGTLAATGNINATVGGLLYIGGVNSGSGDFSGQLDDMRIYPRALSAAQVFQRYIDTKNGISDSSTLVPQETLSGEQWRCRVIPNDSWQDGTAQQTNQITITSNNTKPRINWYSPADSALTAHISDTLIFKQVSSDPNSDQLTYQWTLDSANQATTQNWTYVPSSLGLHTVALNVSDGHGGSDVQEWKVTVTDGESPQQYQLIIQAGPGGTTSPAPGTYMHDAGTSVSVTGIPDANMKLDYWLLNGTPDGNANPYIVLLDDNHNLTAVFAARPADAYLVVRGAHDEIYYRIYNSTISSWEDWKAIPEGATCDSPAAAMYSGRLYFVVRGMDGQSLWFGSVNLTDYSFSGWAGLSGATPSAPVLAVYDSKLILVVRGFADIVYYRYYDIVSETWGEWIAILDGATCDSPAVAVLGTNLHLAVRGFSATDVWGNNTLWHGIVNLADDSFSGWTSVEGWAPSAPRLTASGALNKLYLAVQGGGNMIWINVWNGAAWEGWTSLPDGATCASPAVTVVNGELHIVVLSNNGDALWHYYLNLSTDVPSGWIRIEGWTPSAPMLEG